jgi:hypothetical protein
VSKYQPSEEEENPQNKKYVARETQQLFEKEKKCAEEAERKESEKCFLKNEKRKRKKIVRTFWKYHKNPTQKKSSFAFPPLFPHPRIPLPRSFSLFSPFPLFLFASPSLIWVFAPFFLSLPSSRLILWFWFLWCFFSCFLSSPAPSFFCRQLSNCRAENKGK